MDNAFKVILGGRPQLLKVVVLYLTLSEHVNLGHIPLFVFLVFWHPRQVSSRLYRVQRRLKGHLRPLSPSPPSLGFIL